MPNPYLERILSIWEAGGWVMIPLLVICLLMFFVGVRLMLDLRGRGFQGLPESRWMEWVRDPRRGEGRVGEIIRYTQDEATSPNDINRRFAEVAVAELGPVDRQLTILGTLVAAAPLVGLLGTVFGMLVTFQALAVGGGGGKVTEAMASGISQALFPPEVGLCVSLPGLIMAQGVRRHRKEYEAFLARLESVTTQQFNQRRSARPMAENPPGGTAAGASSSSPGAQSA